MRTAAMDVVRPIVRYTGLALLVVAILLLLGLVVLETDWAKNRLRQTIVEQAGRYLNGRLSIERLSGNIFTGVQLDNVVLRHEEQDVVALDRLTLRYSPLTLMSRGLILDSLTIDRATVVLDRGDAGWNFNRFVKTRTGPAGSGAPPITFESIVLTDSHVIVRERGRTTRDVIDLDGTLRFAYLKPGLRVSLEKLSARIDGLNVHRVSGDISTQESAIRVSDLVVDTDRSHIRATLDWQRKPATSLSLTMTAERLSLPEAARFFPPLEGILLEPSVELKAAGTLERLAMDLQWRSSAGNLSGPLVAGLQGDRKSVEGMLSVEDLNLAPFLKRPDRQTRITGDTEFTLGFGSGAGVREIDASFRFTGPEVEGLGYRAQRVRATGQYRPGLLKFDASGNAYGAAGTARGTFNFPSGGALSYSLDGRFSNLDLRRLPASLKVPQMESRLAGRYEFQSRPGAWSGNAELGESTIEGAALREGTVVSAGSQNEVLTYSAAGGLAGLNPARFAEPLDFPLLDDPRLNGTLTGTFEMTGSGRTVDELSLHTNASLVDSEMAGTRFPDARVDAVFEDRHLTVAFDGSFDELRGSAFGSTQVLNETELNGSANMTVRLALPEALPVEVMEARGTASVRSSTVAGVAVDKAFVDGDYAGRTATIRAFELLGPTTQATASGVLALGETGQSNLIYDLNTTDVEALAKRFGRAAAGSVHVKGDATGPASDLQFSGSVEGSRLKYGDSVDALTLNGTYSGHLPDLDLSRIAVDSSAMGAFLTVGSIHVSTAEAQITYAARQLEFRTTLAQERRSLGVQGNALFHPDHNEVHLRSLNLMVGQTEWALAPGQAATIRYGGDTIDIDGFFLQRGEQRLLVEGTMALGAAAGDSTENALKIRAEQVQVRDINEIMLGTRTLEGILDGTADVGGTWKNPLVDARFSLTKGSVEGVTFNGLAGTATYQDSRVTLDARLEQTPSAFVTVKGTAPVPGRAAPDALIDLDVQSTAVSLGLLQVFTREVTNVSGQIEGNVHVAGTLEAPSLTGRIDIVQGGFAVTSTQVAYGNMTGRFTLDGDRILIDRFEISDDDRDQLVALGQLGIERRTVGQLTVQLSASQFKLMDNPLGQVEVDADIRITGDARRPEITGEVSTREGRIEVDRLLEQLLNNPYSTEATSITRPAVATSPGGPGVAQPSPSPSLYDAASIAVRLRLPDDLLLRGRDMQAGFAPIGLGDMNITVGGDLQLRKAPGAEPDVVGTVSVVRGYYDFQGRRFEVLRDSQIRFEGVQPVDPSLRVTAEREISGVTAVVQIRGTARQPELAISSRPPLDEADILSLIVFNQPINQLGQGERLNLAERAAGLAAGYLAAPIANSIADALDLDLFEIRASSDTTGQPSVLIGQQLGSRLFVAFREEFGAEDRSELSLEYRINRFLRLVTSIAQGAQRSHRGQRVEANGTDLIFVIDY